MLTPRFRICSRVITWATAKARFGVLAMVIGHLVLFSLFAFIYVGGELADAGTGHGSGVLELAVEPVLIVDARMRRLTERAVDMADICAGAGDTDDDALAPALVTHAERIAHHLDVADALEGVVDATVGNVHDQLLDHDALAGRDRLAERLGARVVTGGHPAELAERADLIVLDRDLFALEAAGVATVRSPAEIGERMAALLS